jgi:hypothetical protein
MTRSLSRLLLCAAVLAGCGPAPASQTPTLKPAKAQGSLGAAEVAFDEAITLAEAGKYPEACVKFEESDRLDHAMNTLFNLADCYAKTGRISSAWEAFSKVASEARQAGKDALKKDAQDRADALKPRISKLTIVVPPEVSGTAGVVIKRNGVLIDSELWNQSVPVDAGEQTVVVTAPLMAPWRETLSIREADSAKVSVPALEPAAMPKQRIGAIAAAGASVAGIVVGGVFGALTISKWGDAVDACAGDEDQSTACPTASQVASAQALGDEASTLGLVSNIGFIVGGAGLVAAGVLWFTAPPADGIASRGRVQIGLSAAGPGSIAGAVRGTF